METHHDLEQVLTLTEDPAPESLDAARRLVRKASAWSGTVRRSTR